MRKIDYLLRLAADSNECCVFDDELAKIVEEASSCLEDDFCGKCCRWSDQNG